MCIFVCILSADPFLTNPGRIHCYSTRRTTALVSCSRPLSLGGASWHCTVCNVMLLLPKRVIQGCLNGAKPSETAPSMRSQKEEKSRGRDKSPADRWETRHLRGSLCLLSGRNPQNPYFFHYACSKGMFMNLRCSFLSQVWVAWAPRGSEEHHTYKPNLKRPFISKKISFP